MYSYIIGKVVEKQSQSIVVDNNGIGYEIFISKNQMQNIELNKEIKIYTYFHVSEDCEQLYGFLRIEDKKMFEKLISVSKIGPKTAILILSKIETSDFALAVISNDLKVLSKLPGVGQKTAQRIVLELKDKIETEDAITSSYNMEQFKDYNELIEALLILGYSRAQVERIIGDVDKSQNIQDQIKMALNLLSRR